MGGRICSILKQFMIAYYQAKETTLSQGFDLAWLTG